METISKLSATPLGNAIISQAMANASQDSQEILEEEEEEQDCDVGVMAMGVHLDINENEEVNPAITQ